LDDADSQTRDAIEALPAASPPIRARGPSGFPASIVLDQPLTPDPMAGAARERDRSTALDEADRRRVLVEWNATEADYPQNKCVHELVEAQAARTPEAIAVVFDNERLTYAQLNARANRVAHRLRSLGVRPDARVAICAERSLEMVVGLLAILKAGGAYVPLDPGYPPERLAYMLSDSAPIAVLTHGGARAAVEEGAARLAYRPPILNLEEDAGPADGPALDPDPTEIGLTSRHLAYVIYTSGSTGQPKGAMNEHRSVVNRLLWGQSAFGLGADDRVLQKTPFSFDVSMPEFFWPLLTGARLVMARPGGHRSPAYLVDVIWREGITTLHFVPSMMQAFLEVVDASKCASLRRVFTSGEALSAGLVRLFHDRLPGVELHNLYGPTETAVEVTAWTSSPGALPATVPIGRPIANTRIYILDDRREPVPIGAPGEIHIGGLPVGRGYLNRPELTAERFIANPFVKGERLYRTGDLGRFRPDGTIEYLGRNDFQVKIRGFRIELGEIEARLADHPGVREAAVLAREDAPGEKRLAAYYTARRDAPAPGLEALRAHLAASLPEYMVPAAYIALEALPLTSSGKLDRNALPAPDSNAFTARGYEPPKGETEEALAGIWAGLLRVERVSRHDNFFELGGHSLMGVRMLSRLRQTLGADMPLAALFAKPVLAEFSAAAEEDARKALPPIEPSSRSGPTPLSFAQQRLWFLAQIEGVSQAYHIPLNVRLRGELDRPALRRALNRLMARHEALRAAFVAVDGQAVQRIAPADLGFALEEQDLAGEKDPEGALQRLIAEESAGPFDLQRGPLARGRLIRIADREHALLITLHHIVSDGWSTGVLNRELSALYPAFRDQRPDPLPDLPIQYADYAVWQGRWLSEAMRQEQADYWRRALAGAPAALDLPTDRPRPPRQDYAGSALPLIFDEGVTAGLKALSLRHGTTLFMTVLAGWGALLSRLSGQEDLVIGVAAANRGRVEIEPLIGFFVNSLALRLNLSGAPSVGELLDRVKKQVLEAQQHEDLPFEQVVEIVRPPRSLAYEPIFQTMFAWQNHEDESLDLPGLTTTSLSAPTTHAKFDLTLTLSEADGRLVGELEYATALFDRETIERHAGYLGRLLEAMAADDTQAIDRLRLLGEAERHQLVAAWNSTEAHPQDRSVHELFEAQAARTPDAIAVTCGDERLTYAELNARANRLAHHLRALGVRPDGRVGICVERSLEMVVGLLAILKAGGAYVPLDPAYPAKRLAYMLKDSAPTVALTDSAARAAIEAAVAELADRPPVIDLYDDSPWVRGPSFNPEAAAGLTPRHLAYVIYTSGSTGQPKGVMVEHWNVTRLFAATQSWFHFNKNDVWTLFHSFAFDFSVWEIWGALIHGGRLVVVSRSTARSPQKLHRLLRQEKVTVLNQTPSAFSQLVAAQEESDQQHSLRYVIFGGEALNAGALKGWLDDPRNRHTRVINMYGITETTVHVTYCALNAADAKAQGMSRIGRPIPDLNFYILDRHREPVPIGAAGEIYVGGAGVARGYLNRPELTAERFIASPFVEGDRLYRSGDLGRYRPDGTIEFLGRNDFQVKIRGFRIEPGEIEARLAEQPGVREAVVDAREDAPGDKRLVAYYTTTPDTAAPGAETLRAHLAASLPEYMIPAAYVRLGALPLTANGKLDRNALPAPEIGDFGARGYEPPLGETEKLVARIWTDLLRLERVGRHDNFFDLGGHSLLGVRLMFQIGKAFGKTLPVGVLFSAPTVADLAQDLDRGVEAPGLISVAPIATGPAGPPIFMIHLIERDLARHLGRRRSIYGLAFGLAAAGSDQDAHWPQSIESFAAHYIDQMRSVQPRGPYRLIGHSLGGLIAYEMAGALAESGETVEFLGLLDTDAPDPARKPRRLPLARVGLNLLQTPPKDLLGRINERLEAIALVRWAKIKLSPTQSKFHLRLHAVRATPYRPKRYRGRVHLFEAAVRERSIVNEPSPPVEAGWRDLASGGLDVHRLPGGHMGIVKDPLAALTAKAIETVLDELP
jgi:amino acid adenylation domain-containing protein